jgi:hypothetical protein
MGVAHVRHVAASVIVTDGAKRTSALTINSIILDPEAAGTMMSRTPVGKDWANDHVVGTFNDAALHDIIKRHGPRELLWVQTRGARDIDQVSPHNGKNLRAKFSGLKSERWRIRTRDAANSAVPSVAPIVSHVDRHVSPDAAAGRAVILRAQPPPS